MKIEMIVLPENSGRYQLFVRKAINGNYIPNDLIFYTVGDKNYVHPKLKILRFERCGKCIKFRLGGS